MADAVHTQNLPYLFNKVSLKTLTETHSEVCLLGDVKCDQVDSKDYAFQYMHCGNAPIVTEF